jgi:hypothetical protein
MKNKATANTHDPAVVQIIGLLQEWHAKRVQKLQMIVQAPADTELVLQGPNGQRVLMEGDERIGFKAGCATALELFGQFPLTMIKTVNDGTDAGDE